MRISIAIASHNEGSNLWRTVRSCLETAEGLAPEIVVVDDASTDGSIAELKRRHGADVRIVPFAERRGVAAAKDLAIRSTHGDVVVMIDAHCKPEPGAVESLVVRRSVSWQPRRYPRSHLLTSALHHIGAPHMPAAVHVLSQQKLATVGALAEYSQRHSAASGELSK